MSPLIPWPSKRIYTMSWYVGGVYVIKETENRETIEIKCASGFTELVEV